MERTVDIVLLPHEAGDPTLMLEAAAEAAGIAPGTVLGWRISKRSIDARSRVPRVNLRVTISTERPLQAEAVARPVLPDVRNGAPVVIVGSGPAGLFAALRCIAHGLRPMVLERGKDVRSRRRDLAAINREQVVDPDSNYCFGEGGAGTYSDGKLYTRSTKRGDVEGILRTLVAFGASPDILVEAHPHIGTNKLPGIIAAIRDAIEHSGGEVRFGVRMTELLVDQGRLRGVLTANGTEVFADHVVLATGHSARDVFTMLVRQGIPIQRKDFALGVRIEHPQAVIDRIRYHCDTRHPYLPPASYSAVQQVDGAGVYSFCMCPGGIIAPCATVQDEVVTNGWSPSKRNNPFANSGIVVELRGDMLGDLANDPLGGMHYQRSVEHAAWNAGGRRQGAPAQRMDDFLRRKPSADLPPCSYQPGIVPVQLDDVLPEAVVRRLRGGLLAFGQKMPGYRTNEAVLVGVESRTSSPVRIPRDPVTLAHSSLPGLYPCGEGAGYAGGIVSAAIDGGRVADAIAASLGKAD